MRYLPLFLAWLPWAALAGTPTAVRDYNDYVLAAVKTLPDGGPYSKKDDATIALGKSLSNDHGMLKQDPSLACPVYCSGASYEAFVGALIKLQREKKLQLRDEIVDGLLVNMQPDGTDVWGRWNANGPGTARLFFELSLGSNTMDWAQAKPGDFMKIFYTDQIGKLEHGHSVVFLGTFTKDGVDYVKYWSSDPPSGRGITSIPKTKVFRAIFSRLQHPENLNNIPSLPKSDPYLASLLTTPSTLEEMKEKIGLNRN
jgi:hypothetical protein